MPNAISVVEVFAKNSLAALHNKLIFCRTVDRQLDNTFITGNVNGFRTGNKVQVNRVARMKSTTGAEILPSDVSNFIEDPIFMTLSDADRRKIVYLFTSEELTLAVTNDKNRLGMPQGEQLATDFEKKVVAECLVGVQCGGVAVGNTTIGTSVGAIDLLNAQAYLDSMACPDGDRTTLLPPFSSAQLSRENLNLFTPTINEKIEIKGYVKEFAGSDLHRFNLLPTLNIPALTGSGALSVDVVDGANSVSVTFGAQTADKAFPAGTLLEFTAQERVNPETRESIGKKYTFATKTTFVIPKAGGALVIPIDDSAKIYGPNDTGARQNITALPLTGAVVTILGANNAAVTDAAIVYDQMLMYNKDAFTVANVPLETDLPGAEASSTSYDGINMRVVRQFSTNVDTVTTRFDTFGEGMAQRAELSYKLLIPQS